MKSFKPIWLSVLFVAFSYQLSLTNIDNLKGTYSILKDEYKHLSLIHGAIAEQFDFVMKVYDYGCLGQTKTIEVNEEDVNIPDPQNASGVVKLVHLFFKRPPNTTGRGDFAVTQALRDDPEKVVLAKSFGFLVGFLGADGFNKKFPKSESTIKDTLTGTAVDDFRNHIVKFKRFATLDASEIHQLLTSQAKKDAQFKTALTTFLIPILHSLYDDETLTKDGIKPTFAKGTTLNILLAVVFKLFGNDKNLLKEFYDKVDEVVNKLSGNRIFNPNSFDSTQTPWVMQKFDPKNKEEYEFIARDLEYAPIDYFTEYYHFEDLVYTALLPGDYPRNESMSTAKYSYDESDQKKTVSFSDCMDNTFRNIINVLVYDKDNVTLSTSKLKARIGIPNIEFDSKLETFYSKFSSPTDTGGKAHNEWAKVISNIPGVAYNRSTGHPGIEARIKGCGYIKNKFGITNQFLIDKRYIVIEDEGDILYEIMPSLRNVIVVFNHLFDLNLFSEEPGDTLAQKFASAFVRPDFVKFYFPKVCEKLKINIDKNPWKNIQNIDEEDYQTKKIETYLILNQQATSFDFILMTANMAHGELTPLTSADKTKESILWIGEKIQDARSESLPYYVLKSLFYIEYSLFHESWKSDFIRFSNIENLIYWLPINNYDFVKNFIETASQSKFDLNATCLKLLRSLINKFPDPDIKNSLLSKFKNLIVLSNEWNAESGINGLPESNASNLIKSAESGIKSDNPDIKNSALDLYVLLVQKGQTFQFATEVAEDAIKSGNPVIALSLYRALFEKNQGFESAIKSAEDGVKVSVNFATKTMALDLYKELFIKNQGFESAIKSAEDAIKSGNLGVALSLYRELFEEKKGFESAIKSAENAIKNDNPGIRQSVLDLYKVLFEKKQGFDSATKAAEDAIKSGNPGIRQSALDLYKVLFEKKEGFESAKEAAEDAIKNDNPDIRASAETLKRYLQRALTGQKIDDEEYSWWPY